MKMKHKKITKKSLRSQNETIGSTSGDNEYDVDTDDDTVIITKYTGSDTDITISDQLGGKDVTKIGILIFDGNNFTSVKIPKNIKKLVTKHLGIMI